MVKQKLKESLKDLFASFGVNNKTTFDIYLKYLTMSKIDESILIKRIIMLILTWKPNYGNKIPSLPEIIGENIEINNEAENERAWLFFINTCCNNHLMKKIKPWVYTAKKMLGIRYVEDRKDEDEKWIKKEFLRIYPTIKAGKIPIYSEPVKYKMEGGTTVAIPMQEKIINKFDANAIKLIKEIN